MTQGGPDGTCLACVAAYQRYDLHALEKYEEFEALALKYEPGPYSVRTCMDQCKMAYKWWLCAQFFPRTAPACPDTVPCAQSCLQVQQSCPYILPDNEDLIHGGSPSFICTGTALCWTAPALQETHIYTPKDVYPLQGVSSSGGASEEDHRK
uniref:Uncharacterized protein n=1 Tax=Neogobius melanostomus TaxID=47308 RepID=A0A8C6WVU8_9GOBI